MLRPSYPIITDRLILRPFIEDDLDAVHAYQGLPEVARYLYWDPRDRAATAEALATADRDAGAGEGGRRSSCSRCCCATPVS